MTQSLSCNLKGQQKFILLHQRRAFSCCRGFPVELDSGDTYQTMSQHWDHEHQQLEQNIAVPSCEMCWRDEKNNLNSYRMIMGQQPKHLNINLSFSNACNHMCAYCSPAFSTTWQNSIETQGNFVGISRSARTNLIPISVPSLDVDNWMAQIEHDIDAQPDDSVELLLTGGEPLMQKDSIKKVLEFNSSKIKKITITTNLSPPDNKFLQWILAHFPRDKLSFDISLDATPEFNHVPRAGFDQGKFIENLALLQSNNMTFTFFAVCSVLNFFDLPKYYKWIEAQGFVLKHHRLNNPDCLDPIWIPNQFTQPILDQLLTTHTFLQALHTPREVVDLKLREQYNYLTQYFARTGTQVSNTVFEPYWHWLKERYENSISI